MKLGKIYELQFANDQDTYNGLHDTFDFLITLIFAFQ